MRKLAMVGGVLSSLIFLAVGCSSTQLQPATAQQGRQQVSAPMILNPRVSPSVVMLDQKLKPTQNPNIAVDIKDLQSGVNDVQAQIENSPDTDPRYHVLKSPVRVQLDHAGGTTWTAKLSDEALKQLAVNGQEMHYQIKVMAKNDAGLVSTTINPIDLTVEAPYSTS